MKTPDIPRALTPLAGSGTPTGLSDEVRAKADHFARQSRAPNTIKAYDAGWRSFAAWCLREGHQALPATVEVVAGYLADRADELRPSTLRLHLAAVAAAHKLNSLSSPTGAEAVRTVLKGIQREQAVSPTRAAAISVAEIRAICIGLANRPRDRRDRALLLCGVAGGFRRSELVDLDVSDIEQQDEGILVRIRRSKTSIEEVLVPISYGASPRTCPVRALRAWMDDIPDDGPLFRGVDRHGNVRNGRLDDGSVARIVKRLGSTIGLDPANLSGHSLRASLLTEAAKAGVPMDAIMAQSRHRSLEVALTYIRRGSVWQRHDDLTRKLGL